MKSDVRVDRCVHGRGLFACRSFAPGDLILRLGGVRFERHDPIHLTETGANLLQTGPRTYIMLEPPAVFANHSCDPNAGIVANRKLVAIRTIQPGEEICYDYSTTMDENFWTMPCRCGRDNCRSLVTDFRLLPPPVREQYLAQGIVQRFIARRYARQA